MGRLCKFLNNCFLNAFLCFLSLDKFYPKNVSLTRNLCFLFITKIYAYSELLKTKNNDKPISNKILKNALKIGVLAICYSKN